MKVKISIVSYSNTLPFLYGLNNAGILQDVDLQMDIPSVCAQKLLTNQVDIGLVPIAVLPEMEKYYIITDYCIGALEKVNSVMLYSDVPLAEMETIMLDYQSKTSINLVQLLAKQYWNISPKFEKTEAGFEKKIQNKTAGVIIGDRTFELKKSFKYQYDLAEEWNKFTKLPFTFACWVSNKKIPLEFVLKLNAALRLGIENIDKSLALSTNNKISEQALKNYLTNDISYQLDEEKRKSIQLFLKYLSENVNI